MEKSRTPADSNQPSRKEYCVTTVLDHLLDDIDPGILSQRDITELRSLRDRCQEVETGLSLGRRLVQGRLDIVMAELQSRTTTGHSADPEVLEWLPEVLAQHTRSGGTPRPIRDTVLPDFTDDIDDALDEILPSEKLTHLSEQATAELLATVDELREFEQAVSRSRHELHRVIDDLQEEIVGRYRSGAATVDDLLR
jgi:hypothetical protein